MNHNRYNDNKLVITCLSITLVLVLASGVLNAYLLFTLRKKDDTFNYFKVYGEPALESTVYQIQKDVWDISSKQSEMYKEQSRILEKVQDIDFRL